MIILAIDTSCDETSVSLLQDNRLIVQEISSQAQLQSKWGGVVPMLAKRKHLERMEFVLAKAIVRAFKWLKISKSQKSTLLKIKQKLLSELEVIKQTEVTAQKANEVDTPKEKVSYRDENPVRKLVLSGLTHIPNPGIDLIAVTIGPGLSVALEVGIEAAKQLSLAWKVPVTPVNHMEGHFFSGLILNSLGKPQSKVKLPSELGKTFPALGFLVSGGHTELVLAHRYGDYEILGQTLDDAAGEAFDKFAVMLNLGYPGGVIIETLAEKIFSASNKSSKTTDNFNLKGILKDYPLPVSMRKSGDLNYSFSGLKTAALYMLNKKGELSAEEFSRFAFAFQHSVIESLKIKFIKAISETAPSLVLAGGGVIANKQIRKMLRQQGLKYQVPTILPKNKFLGDNASMIGFVGYLNFQNKRDIYSPESAQLLDRLPSLKISQPINEQTN